MSIESDKAIQELQSKINDLKNVHRLVSNNLNLIYDVDIKGSHVLAVGEIVGWLEAFKKSLASQFSALEASLPRVSESKPPQAAEPVQEAVVVE